MSVHGDCNEKSTGIKKKLLSVSVDKSNRSPVAQAFTAIHGASRKETFSAGSRPSESIHPKAIRAGQEPGYDLSTHTYKSLAVVEGAPPYVAVAAIDCGQACPGLSSRCFVEWQIPDRVR